jgi:hypothetical protein
VLAGQRNHALPLREQECIARHQQGLDALTAQRREGPAKVSGAADLDELDPQPQRPPSGLILT